ncbi:hypothetical protein [Paenibacillus sp. FSL P4-0288]|uniref:hypothetical protein n=1 Tax=Paenibacillus sp. FSL P4-0288 TaxID=2921633 RepID=UPI0030F7B531
MQLTFEIGESDDDIDISGMKRKEEKKVIKKSTNPNSKQRVWTTLMMFNDEGVGEYGPWVVTKKTDQDCVALADRHYSRVTVGASQFTRPGDNLVLRTQCGDAVWVSWYSNKRDDEFIDVIECTIFRNESEYLSSDLVKWAIYASIQKWGIPKEGFITFVKDSAVRSSNPGANYQKAGFKKVGETKVRKLSILQLSPDDVPAAIEEVMLIQNLITAKELITLALEDGEFTEAISLFNEAIRVEKDLRKTSSARTRLKGKKIDCFDSNEDSIEFLSSLFPDGWVPEDLMELIEDLDEEFYS